MEGNTFYILSAVCIAANIIRTVYEILKYKKIINANKITFTIIFTNMFVLYSGKPQLEYFPKTASTAIANGAALKLVSGTLEPIAAGNTVPVAGVSLRVVSATDADFASTSDVPVFQLGPDCVFLADVGAGTYDGTQIGGSFDVTDSLNVDLTASAHNNVTVVGGIIGANQVYVKFNSAYEFVNLS